MTGKLAAIFDLDGTLIDSAPDIRAALNRLLILRGMPALDADAVQSMIGDGAKILVERAFAAYGRPAGPMDFSDFLTDYEANATVETVAYPGIEAALTALAAGGHGLAICTNKPAGVATSIVQELGLRKFFNCVIGGDSTLYRKPDPRHLAGAVTALGATHAVMIGDHKNDIEAARGLEMPSIFAAWGYGQAQGTYTAQSPAELPGIIALL
jgi:phosphoglycolate phosphatase